MAYLEHLQGFVYQCLLGLALCCLIIRLIRNRYGGGLNHIPGPFLAAYTNLWRVFLTSFGDMTATEIALHKKYNSTFVRLGPRLVSVSDPALVPIIYGVNSGFTKTEFVSIIDLHDDPNNRQHALFEARDEAYHARILKPIAGAYSLGTMLEFEPAVDSTIGLLMSKLDRFVASGSICMLNTWLQWYTFDVLGEIMFSKRFGFLDTEADVEAIITGIRWFSKYWQAIGQIAWLDRFLLKNPLMVKFGPLPPMAAFAKNRLAERTVIDAGGWSAKKDFLQRCVDAKEKYPDIVTDRTVFLYTFNNIGAGSDTTSIVLTALMYFLLKSPGSLEKVIQEIDDADQAGKFGRYMPWHEAQKLQYFQACLKEALRMHPPVGLYHERYVPKGGVDMGGHYFPEGTTVGVNAWVTARDREVYGDDCDAFKPERWLEASKEQLSKMEQANFAFGYGNRACIGKNIAMLEISKLVPQLLRCYTFSLAHPDLEWKVASGWFKWQDRVEVVIKSRQSILPRV